MITIKDFTSSVGDVVTVKYPTGTIFMRERNYLTVSCAADDYYLKKIVLAGKTINFGRYYLFDGPMELDITPYYAKLYSLVNISIVVENQSGVDETFTVSFNITKIDGYSPYKEIAITEPCSNNTYARITPPNRMLYAIEKGITSIFAAVRGVNTTKWTINGTDYNTDVVLKDFAIGADGFLAEFKSDDNVIYRVKRSVDKVDSSRKYVFVRWKTPWGYYVEHIFYLDTFGADKDNTKEVETTLNYAELSDYIRKGSIYLDNIREPYDLFYYKTLETAEVVEIWTKEFNQSPSVYMPDGTAYEAVKITGSNVQDAVVYGVTQQTITFDFELL